MGALPDEQLSERIVALKKAAARLHEKYGSLDALEDRIRHEGVSPDDHTLYTDLLAMIFVSATCNSQIGLC